LTKKTNKKKHSEITDKYGTLSFEDLIKRGVMTEEGVYVAVYLKGHGPGKPLHEMIYEARQRNEKD
jgi:hypothetical protein